VVELEEKRTEARDRGVKRGYAQSGRGMEGKGGGCGRTQLRKVGEEGGGQKEEREGGKGEGVEEDHRKKRT